MNNHTATDHQQALQQDAGSPRGLRAIFAFEFGDLKSLILTAIAAAFLAGLLVLPITMPGTTHHSARANLPASDAPTALVEGPASFEA